LIRRLANQPLRQGLNNAANKPLQVASPIRAKLGDLLDYTFLVETFKDQANHTPAQGALMRANFQGVHHHQP